ncbi:hypothetical protein D9758_017165 [Tetrapyrgos nigripes]|uniref:T6SS Phospholipase effector Tle1-like catalytic domain-containing protein n=1 Tax=Tetrapyrgos nigripes TaxID=182062 RepID=A0A8H5C908_9AGAR|nr:hypothetical protein D9758_017165 [Tetrapyrgos nigripes]
MAQGLVERATWTRQEARDALQNGFFSAPLFDEENQSVRETHRIDEPNSRKQLLDSAKIMYEKLKGDKGRKLMADRTAQVTMYLLPYVDVRVGENIQPEPKLARDGDARMKKNSDDFQACLKKALNTTLEPSRIQKYNRRLKEMCLELKIEPGKTGSSKWRLPSFSIFLQSVCDGRCEDSSLSTTPRNLIVCIDGTSNQFGIENTNVVELCSRIIKDEYDTPQLTYYNSGIGTYTSSSRASIRQTFWNVLDLMFAWKFERVVQGAYRWLSDHYQPGDKIYLFGFSRGAYQIRTLAGMIDKIGLMYSGNVEQIPLVKVRQWLSFQPWEIESNLFLEFKGKTSSCQPQGRGPNENRKSDETLPANLAGNFKRTFSRSVGVHFVGVWDTVSPIGISRGPPLPGTMDSKHICFFRQALALDEDRVKFLPEYVHGGAFFDPKQDGFLGQEQVSMKPDHSTKDTHSFQTVLGEDSIGGNVRVKEVWFAGNHSDIGGENLENVKLDLASPSLTWMENEASTAGLLLKSRNLEDTWFKHESGDSESRTITRRKGWTTLFQDQAAKVLWCILENSWVKQLAYDPSNPGQTQRSRRRRHMSNGRVIVSGQKLHASLAFKKDRSYMPKATSVQLGNVLNWSTLVGSGETDTIEWLSKWNDSEAIPLEVDVFDRILVRNALGKLEEDRSDLRLNLNYLYLAASSRPGAEMIKDHGGIMIIADILKNKEFQVQSADCLTAIAKYYPIVEIQMSKSCMESFAQILHLPDKKATLKILRCLKCIMTHKKFGNVPISSDLVNSLLTYMTDIPVEASDLQDNQRCSAISFLLLAHSSQSVQRDRLLQTLPNLQSLLIQVAIPSDVKENIIADQYFTSIKRTSGIVELLETFIQDSSLNLSIQQHCLSCLCRLIAVGGPDTFKTEIIASILNVFMKLICTDSLDMSRREALEYIRQVLVGELLIERLRALLKDKKPSVRFWAIRIFLLFAKYTEFHAKMSGIVDELLELMETEGETHLGVITSCSLVIQTLQHEDCYRSQTVKRAVKLLQTTLDSGPDFVQATDALRECDAVQEVWQMSGRLSRLDAAVSLLIELTQHGLSTSIVLSKNAKLKGCRIPYLPHILMLDDSLEIIHTSYPKIIPKIYELIPNSDIGLQWKAVEILTHVTQHNHGHTYVKAADMENLLSLLSSNPPLTLRYSIEEALGAVIEVHLQRNDRSQYIDAKICQVPTKHLLKNMISCVSNIGASRTIGIGTISLASQLMQVFSEIKGREDMITAIVELNLYDDIVKIITNDNYHPTENKYTIDKGAYVHSMLQPTSFAANLIASFNDDKVLLGFISAGAIKALDMRLKSIDRETRVHSQNALRVLAKHEQGRKRICDLLIDEEILGNVLPRNQL